MFRFYEGGYERVLADVLIAKVNIPGVEHELRVKPPVI